MHEDIAARVRAYVLHHTLITAGDMVLVAVSGGADSLCLLYVLHALSGELGCRLHVAHLDHALRPQSAADLPFVAAHAAALGLPCTVERRPVAPLARRQRLSLEAAARRVRYDFLRQVAAACGASSIATGHTRDDQAETLLLHLARGSGLNGLAGMRPRRDDVIRPLLELSHAETSAYCAALELAPREDASNRSRRYRRNRLRHDVLPRLERVQPGAAANIARSARLLAGDLALIERLAETALHRATTTDGSGAMAISAAAWREGAAELRPHMLRLLVMRLLGSAEGFDERHYRLMQRALDFMETAGAVALPKGLWLERRGDAVTLQRGQAAAPPPPQAQALPVPGCVVTAAGTLRSEPAVAPRAWSGLPKTVAYLDAMAVAGGLLVRARRPGDRVRPLGLNGTRKVQDVLVDCKVPREWRDHIPIVEGPRGIAWIAGCCSGEAYRTAPGANAVRVEWAPIEW